MDTARGRRRGAAGWRLVLERFELSGLTAAAFCEREGISSKSLYRWRSLLARTPDRGAARKAVGVAHAAAGFVDLGTLGQEGSRVELRLDLGQGMVLSVARG